MSQGACCAARLPAGRPGVAPDDGRALPPALLMQQTRRGARRTARCRDAAGSRGRTSPCAATRSRPAPGAGPPGPVLSAAPVAARGTAGRGHGLVTFSAERDSSGPTSPVPHPHPRPRVPAPVQGAFLSLVFSDSTCERDHTVLAVLCLTHLTSRDVPKGQSRCHSWQDRSQRLKGQPRQPPVLTPTQAHAPAWPVTAWAPLGPGPSSDDEAVPGT